jgi:hypothetical protein
MKKKEVRELARVDSIIQILNKCPLVAISVHDNPRENIAVMLLKHFEIYENMDT